MDEQEGMVAGADGRVTADAAAHARLLELAALCDFCRTSFHETATRFHWQPAVPSVGALMARAVPSPDPKLATPRPETGHRLVSRVVQTYLVTAAGHLGSMSALLAHEEVMFSPGMLVRGLIECAARVFWVLGKPGDSPEQILARAYLEELLSAEQAKKAAGRMGGKEDAIHKTHEQTWKGLRAEIIGRFDGASKEDLGKGVLCAEKRPGPQDAVTDMFDLLEMNRASSINPRTRVVLPAPCATGNQFDGSQALTSDVLV
jgi:hypothetical protein